MVLHKADTNRDRTSSSNNITVRHNSKCTTSKVHPQVATMTIEDEEVVVVQQVESVPVC